jgi:hypothetical protein
VEAGRAGLPNVVVVIRKTGYSKEFQSESLIGFTLEILMQFGFRSYCIKKDCFNMIEQKAKIMRGKQIWRQYYPNSDRMHKVLKYAQV